jgi:VanZ family protein
MARESRSARAGRLASLALPPLLLMGLIWFLSSQPDLTTGLGLADLIGRKVVHAVSFGLLALLWWRVLRERLAAMALPVAAAIALAYGAVDEYHQAFVPGRTGSPVDVAIDALGVAVAALLLLRRRRPGRGAEPATASRAR